MASSLKELIEEWEARSNIDWSEASQIEKYEARAITQCISDLRDIMLVMEAEQFRKGTFSVFCSNGHILPDGYWGKECPVCMKEAEEVRRGAVPK